MKINGARVIVESLCRHGVTTIFGYPGGAVLPLYDELYKNAGRIEHVLTAHEQGAAHAADGYARVSGKTGVVIATSGPGATNLVTGIANAYLDSVPVVAITGNVTVPLLGRDSFQEVDIVGITQPVVKHSYVVRDPDKLEYTLDEAFAIANSGRRGPVLVDVPKSIQSGDCAYSGGTEGGGATGDGARNGGARPGSAWASYGGGAAVRFSPGWPRGGGAASPDAGIRQAAEAIKACKRPYIYAGGGVLSSGAEAELLALSKKISAPTGFSMMGMTALPYDYALNLGMCGMHGKYAASAALAECDLLIAAGVRFSDRATGDADKFGQGRVIIHIDIDRAEIGKNIEPQIDICGDAKEILARLSKAVPQKNGRAWLGRVVELKQAEDAMEAALETAAEATVESALRASAASDLDADVYKNGAGGFFGIPGRDALTPRGVVETVNRHMREDAVVATDVGQHQMWTLQYYRFSKPRTLLTSGGLGTMGYGLGAAIGGCIANGRQRTALFTSDGSFGMNLNELATAVTQALPILVVILNNGALGMVRQWQTLFYEKCYSQTTLNRKTDFAALARAFGAAGYTVDDRRGLDDILRGLPGDGPVVIDCRISPDEKVLPMIPPGGTIKDIILK